MRVMGRESMLGQGCNSLARMQMPHSHMQVSARQHACVDKSGAQQRGGTRGERTLPSWLPCSSQVRSASVPSSRPCRSVYADGLLLKAEGGGEKGREREGGGGGRERNLEGGRGRERERGREGEREKGREGEKERRREGHTHTHTHKPNTTTHGATTRRKHAGRRTNKYHDSTQARIRNGLPMQRASTCRQESEVRRHNTGSQRAPASNRGGEWGGGT